jgi:hypothetical protein
MKHIPDNASLAIRGGGAPLPAQSRERLRNALGETVSILAIGESGGSKANVADSFEGGCRAVASETTPTNIGPTAIASNGRHPS